MIKEFLKQVSLFSTLEDDDLTRLCELVTEVELKKGEILFEENDNAEAAYVIKSGRLDVLQARGDRKVLLAMRSVGEVIGEMALFEENQRSATLKAATDVILIKIQKTVMDTLLESSTKAARSMFQTIVARLRSTQSLFRQSEKMAQLGTLSAGLAHELNNPASSVARSAHQIKDAVNSLLEAQTEIARTKFNETEDSEITKLIEIAIQNASKPPDMNAITRSDKEYEIEEFLNERGIDESWEYAPILVNLNLDHEQLVPLASTFDGEKFAVIVSYLGKVYNVYNLLYEVGLGAERVSSIVKALKDYAYLDQAPVGEIDLHEGIDNTLLILRNKLKYGINVIKDYDEQIPKVEAYGSELNQVWTNLIDNAADAMDGKGELILRTKLIGEWIQVDIQDNGPGMTEEVREKIFTPFFTTKPPGKGTGLGLDISYNIIVNKHRGDIKVISQPGMTIFRVFLPVNFATLEEGASPLDIFLKPTDEKLKTILDTYRNIAVVGISNKENQPNNVVPSYLHQQGYNIIPVNPNIAEIFGKKSSKSLKEIQDPIDIILIFRESQYVMGIVKEAIELKPLPKVIWMQEGIINQEAAEYAQHYGIDVIMDQCMRMSHKRLKN